MPTLAKEPVIRALHTVLDPEVGINVVDLGLVYAIDIADQDIRIGLTMTSQACPLGAYMQHSVEQAIRKQVPDARQIEIAMVWQPPWDPAMVSAEARRLLGWRS